MLVPTDGVEKLAMHSTQGDLILVQLCAGHSPASSCSKGGLRSIRLQSSPASA